MTGVLLPVVLLAGIATLSIVIMAMAVGTLRSSRRLVERGENRYKPLHDQHDQRELLRGERWMLLEEELERGSRERQQFTEFLEEVAPRLVESLEQAREERKENARRAEQREQERLQLEEKLQQLKEELERDRAERRGHLEAQRRVEGLQREYEQLAKVRHEAGRLGQELQRLTEELEKERADRQEAQARAENLQKEWRLQVEGELQRLTEELDKPKRLQTDGQVEKPEAPRPWWRKLIVIVALLFGIGALWLVSLVVALSLQ